MDWTPAKLPALDQKTYLVTGGNSGLGFEAACILARKGARVVISTRGERKAQDAMARIRERVPAAQLDFVRLDLCDPGSISAAAAELTQRYERLDAVVNNAGIMQPPLTRTAEGFELQMATNHLGHFRLNAQLLDLLEASAGRIVVVSSIAHKFGRIRFDDLMCERSYDPVRSYAQSKLANLLYALELDRRLRARGSSISAIACHPGYAATSLQSKGVGMDGGSSFFRGLYALTNRVIAQSAERGAYPLVLAAAEASAQAGEYYGPTGIAQMRGSVGPSFVAKRARDESVAAKLWERSEQLVGTFFDA